ncbi:hypothetical protein Leryth_025717 [Lithospermum erythrorhizon]|nr:hypothetical protein Leryth_025717 [Lithospermum erythrorhizon]
MKENGSSNLNKPFLHDNSRSHRKLKSEDEQLEATNFATIDGSPTREAMGKDEDKYEVAFRQRIDLNKLPIDVGSIDSDWSKEMVIVDMIKVLLPKYF